MVKRPERQAVDEWFLFEPDSAWLRACAVCRCPAQSRSSSGDIEHARFWQPNPGTPLGEGKCGTDSHLVAWISRVDAV